MGNANGWLVRCSARLVHRKMGNIKQQKLMRTKSLLLILALLFAHTAWSGDFEDGAAAYLRKDYETALAKLRKAAEKADAAAQLTIGVMYANGQGVAQDYREAVHWYTLAAKQGLAQAQTSLATMYNDGKGVTQDYKSAVHWYQLAAQQGNRLAQNNLGYMYRNGEGVTKDNKEAVRWYQLAAKQGLAQAQNNLGFMYANGQGVAQDYVRAHMWSNIAAINGDKDSVKNRDIAARKMTPQQVEQAQRMARECMASNFKKCD
jgi:TPR repeat protein